MSTVRGVLLFLLVVLAMTLAWFALSQRGIDDLSDAFEGTKFLGTWSSSEDCNDKDKKWVINKDGITPPFENEACSIMSYLIASETADVELSCTSRSSIENDNHNVYLQLRSENELLINDISHHRCSEMRDN